MSATGPHKLMMRVLAAAQDALEDHRFVSAVDVFVGIRLLEPSHLQAWQSGRIDALEEMIQGRPERVSAVLEMLGGLADAKGLIPYEVRYTRPGRDGPVDLRFTLSGDPGLERKYRTHFLAPDLSEREQEKLKQRVASDRQPVVFQILRDSTCSECGAALERNALLFMEAGQRFAFVAQSWMNSSSSGEGMRR